MLFDFDPMAEVDRSFDLPAFFRVRKVQHAAKEHICAWGCGKSIVKGSAYEAVSYKLDGKFSYDRVHDANGRCFMRKIEREQK